MKKITAILFALGLCGTAYCMPCIPGHFEVGADWLYWKPFQDNLEVAFERTDTVTITETVRQLDPINPFFRADSGFRIYADYVGCENQWVTSAIYSRLVTSTRKDHQLDPADIGTHFIELNSNSFPIFNLVTSNGIVFSDLNTRWRLDFNYFDLDVSRTFCVCPWFDIAPHMGLRGMWIKQRLNLAGVGINAQEIPASMTSTFRGTYDGYGLEGGLCAHLTLGGGFAFSGYLNGSLLYTRSGLNETLSLFPTGSPSITINIAESVHHLSPVFDGFVGFEYDRLLCGCLIDLYFGWEQHIVVNAFHFGSFNYADLTLQGLTLGASIGF